MIEGAPEDRFVRVYRKSEIVFQEDSTGSEMYIVCSGKVKLYTRRGPARETVLAMLEPGEHFGEMALIDSSPRSASAVAVEDDTRLVVLDKAKFLYLIQQQPEFAFAMMETLSQRIRETNLQLAKARADHQA